MDEDDDRDRRERKGRWDPDTGSGIRFKAMVDFERGPFSYAEGMSYTADSEALDDLVDQWLDEGFVMIVSESSSQMETQPVIVGGNGIVKNGDS